ncbi:MAG: hypothetical protein RL660_2633 [Bacteroidota bacterium]
MDVREAQKFFLKNQFWQLTISAAFSRNTVYHFDPNNCPHSKKEFEQKKILLKVQLFNLVEDMLQQYKQPRDIEKLHLDNIGEICRFSCDNFGSILQNNSLNFGTAQKILNLYLKYLWCSNLIDFIPPHFPIDRLVQQKALKRVEENWTDIDSRARYISLLDKFKSHFKDRSPAVWELGIYNTIVDENDM